MWDTKRGQHPFRGAWTAIMLTVFGGGVIAGEASVIGSALSVPVTQVGEDYYALEFDFISSFDPARIELRSATPLPNPDTSDLSTYNLVTGRLSLPKVTVQSATYSAEFSIVGGTPVQLELTSAVLLSSNSGSVLVADRDADGIADAMDAFPDTPDSQYLTDSQRIEIALILGRFSEDLIDPINGCGYRKGYGTIDGFWGRYPDGVLRPIPKGGSYDIAKATRLYDNDDLIADTTVQYWADWLRYSPDLEQMKSAFYENVWSPQWQWRIDLYEEALASDDVGFCEVLNGCNESVDQMRVFYTGQLESFKKQLTDVRMVSGGYDIMTRNMNPHLPRNSPLPRDVGYWTFTADGSNSISDGARFLFEGEIGGDGLNFDGRRLLVPKVTSENYDQAFGGQVIFDSPPLDRSAFTLGFSFQNGALPTTPGLDPKLPLFDERVAREANQQLLAPRQLLFSAGSYYRWLHINLNQSCEIELELNYSPLGFNPMDQNYTFVVSDLKLDPTKWNDVYLTFNVPDKQISILAKTQENPRGRIETFSLPDDFEWSFTDNWEAAGFDSLESADNSLNLFSGSGSGYFYGELDWIYAANGIQSPSEVEENTGQLELIDVPPSATTEIELGDDGSVISAVLSSRDYTPWLEGGFVSGGVRNDVLRNFYRKFDDDFDFVLMLSNEVSTSLSYAGMYVAVSNAVEGITNPANLTPTFDRSANAGSNGQLQGAIHFPTRWGLGGGPSLHEIMHRWGNEALFTSTLTDEGSKPESQMAPGGGVPHWGISSINGQLGGFDLSTLKDLGNGVYEAAPFGSYANGGNRLPYSNFELYLMGLIPPEEVDDVVLFTGLSATNEQFYDRLQWRATNKVELTSADIVELLGERSPDHRASQKKFKAVVVVLSTQALTEDDWAHFSDEARAFEETFAWATGYRATLELGNLTDSLK